MKPDLLARAIEWLSDMSVADLRAARDDLINPWLTSYEAKRALAELFAHRCFGCNKEDITLGQLTAMQSAMSILQVRV